MTHDVALRKESVDRNMVLICAPSALIAASLSARRAWIEIGRKIVRELLLR